MDKEKGLDVIDQYKNITNKLKKKFFKKPNIAEGSEQFESLARQQKADDNPHYAGMCFLAQARCEQSLGNWVNEMTALAEAARSFSRAEKCLRDSHCCSFHEDLHSAINCYSHAIRVNTEREQPVVASALCVELSQCFKLHNRPGESIQHLERAVDLLKDCPEEQMYVMELQGEVLIETGNYDEALNIYTNLFQLAKSHAFSHPVIGLESTSRQYLCHSEVFMVLLLLIIKPTVATTTQRHCQLIQKYTWPVDEKYFKGFTCNWVVGELSLINDDEEEDGGVDNNQLFDSKSTLSFDDDVKRCVKANGSSKIKNYMSLEFFFALQSLAMACECNDEDEILASEMSLQEFLAPKQLQLVRLLVRRHFESPSSVP